MQAMIFQYCTYDAAIKINFHRQESITLRKFGSGRILLSRDYYKVVVVLEEKCWFCQSSIFCLTTIKILQDQVFNS